MARRTLSIPVSILLVLIAFGYFIEHSNPDFWNSQLVQFNINPQVQPNTPLVADGYVLPNVISSNLTLRQEDTPILLTGTTTISPQATVDIEPGVAIYASQASQLIVEGTLRARGDVSRPVVFTSGEQHPDNAFWGGILFTSGSQGTLRHTTLHDGAPSVTCDVKAEVIIENSVLKPVNLALYTASSTCSLANSKITGARTGIAALNIQPVIAQTSIDARRSDIVTVSLP